MKIHPPKVTIDSNDPFKEAFFARKDFAESLTGLLRNINENLVIFVNAPWGEGKTTFASMWQASLRQQKFEVIYFDAYAADYFDDPFVSFSGEILALAKKRFPDTKGVAERREFKKTAVDLGKRLAGLAFKVGIRAATMGAVEVAHLTELKDIGSELSAGISEIGADFIEKKIENHGGEKDALAAFKRSLTKLAAVVRDEQGFPLTIFVDELDRCRPDFALGLLERIKHLFDVEGVTFVLFVNRDQIESYIRALYGIEVDSAAYLLKFGNLFVDLPNEQPVFRHEKGRQEYCRELFQHFGFSTIKDGSTVSRSVETLVAQFGLTLREIERAFTVMALYYSSLPDRQLTHPFLVPMLSILKVKRPSIYGLLRRANLSANEFFRDTRLDQLTNNDGQGMNPEWVADILNFCLMSEAEFEQATKDEEGKRNSFTGPGRMGQWLVSFNVDRKNVIPFFCERLDRFSLQP